MKNSLMTSTIVSIGLLGSLLALEHRESVLPRQGPGGLLRDAVGLARGRDPSLALLNGHTAGYYEQLLRGSDERGRGKKLIDWIKGTKTTLRPQADNYTHGGFLVYQLKPNLNVSDSEEGPMLTNSYGFSDSEYALQKPPNTTRIAVMGDSFTRGWGLPMGERFESRLEDRLNAEIGMESGRRFQALNLSVSAYRITQMYDVALEKAPAFQPDIYMLALTALTVGASWGDHLAELTRMGTDLKYDFLRDVVRASGIQKDDEGPVMQAKLEPYRLRVFREILGRLNERVKSQSARLTVALVSAPEDEALAARRFRDIRGLLKSMDIPVLDLTDTFDRVANVETMRVAWYDLHPNSEGHRLLADNLYRKLGQQPALASPKFLGSVGLREPRGLFWR